MTKPPHDCVTVSVTVRTDPATAFEIFTTETDLWWRRGPRYRMAGRNPGVIRFEPQLGGALYEDFESANGKRTHHTGQIIAWNPPARFAFTWRASNFAPDETTTVEVTFEPVPVGTRVTVNHSGWASLRGDHPVRHGAEGPAFIGNQGLWWASLMTSLREYAVDRAPTAST